MKKTALAALLAIFSSCLVNAQTIVVKNGTACTQTFQIGAYDATCHHYVSYVLTVDPYGMHTYSVTDPGVWSSTPPATATIDAVHVIPSCTSPVNLAIATACTPGISSGSYTCSCGTNNISFTVVSSTVNQLLFMP